MQLCHSLGYLLKENRMHSSNTEITSTRGENFVLPQALSPIHVNQCKVMANRFEMVRKFPKNARVAEVGAQTGKFSKHIWENLRPREFHLYDISFYQENFPFDHAYFEDPVLQGKVFLHEGDSSSLLNQMPDEYFDWIYIDADHSYSGVVKDVEVAKFKIKPNGLLVFNDYMIYSPIEDMQYGVNRAVNDLCLNENFEMVYFAFNVAGYHDVCLRRRGSLPWRLARSLRAKLQRMRKSP